MIRLSGLLANRPAASTAVGARYYATDNEIVYLSAGSWITDRTLDPSDVVGYLAASLAQRPSSASHLGWVFVDTDTGDEYEAFPSAWAAVTTGGSIQPISPLPDAPTNDDEIVDLLIAYGLCSPRP